MDFLEKDLEQIIWDDREINFLEEFADIRFRQKKIGNYGIADLIGAYFSHEPKFKDGKVCGSIKTLIVTVYELKKDKVGISAFLQAVGYVKGITQYLENRKLPFEFEVNICLIGREIDKYSTFCYLVDILPLRKYGEEFLRVYTYNYTINGLSLNRESGYSLTDHGLNNIITF